MSHKHAVWGFSRDKEKTKQNYLFWHLATMQPKKGVPGECFCPARFTTSPLLYEVKRFLARGVNQLVLLPLPQLARKTSTSDLAWKSTGWPMTTKCSSKNMKYKTREPQTVLGEWRCSTITEAGWPLTRYLGLRSGKWSEWMKRRGIQWSWYFMAQTF